MTKLRELILVPWRREPLTETPSIGVGDLHIRPILAAPTGANGEYFSALLQHLESYDLVKERDGLLDQIKEHNHQVDGFEERRRRIQDWESKGLPETLRVERGRLQKQQDDIWKCAVAYGEKLQGVINNLEDGIFKGVCDYETRFPIASEVTKHRSSLRQGRD